MKVVLMGETGVGKTSLVKSICDSGRGLVNERAVAATIGVDFISLPVIVRKRCDVPPGTTIRLQIWDTAGQERFRSLASTYIRSAQAVILCWDSPETLEKLEYWARCIDERCDPGVIGVAVRTKSDLGPNPVSPEKRAWLGDNGYVQFECSAATGEGIAEIFQHIAERAPLDTVDINREWLNRESQSTRYCCA